MKVKINENIIDVYKFAYDGCHKIYIIEDDDDFRNAIAYGYDIYDIEELAEKYKHSCDLRFINNWKLNKTYASQFTNATIEFLD